MDIKRIGIFVGIGLLGMSVVACGPASKDPIAQQAASCWGHNVGFANVRGNYASLVRENEKEAKGGLLTVSAVRDEIVVAVQAISLIQEAPGARTLLVNSLAEIGAAEKEALKAVPYEESGNTAPPPELKQMADEKRRHIADLHKCMRSMAEQEAEVALYKHQLSEFHRRMVDLRARYADVEPHRALLSFANRREAKEIVLGYLDNVIARAERRMNGQSARIPH